MKTLVIHPADTSTDFLKPIYQSMPVDSYMLIDSPIAKGQLKKLVKQHDRIIMLGHGDMYGMYGFEDYIIDKSFAYGLRNKPNNVYIWCNANDFVRPHGLSGFATGMIVSEMAEALVMAIRNPQDEQIAVSNDLFTKAITGAIHLPKAQMVESVKHVYTTLDNDIIKYNMNNIHHY